MHLSVKHSCLALAVVTGSMCSCGRPAPADTEDSAGTTGPGCGDGLVDPTEDCDDANDHDDDGCDADCVGSSISRLPSSGASCVITRTGGARCWGVGQVAGTPSPIGDDEPAAASPRIAFDSAVIDIARGGTHACALLADGSVRCWGYTSRGLGYGSLDAISPLEMPPPIALDEPVVSLAANRDRTCAVTDTGSLYCWGSCDCLATNGDLCITASCLGYGSADEYVGDDETPAAAGPIDLAAQSASVHLGRGHTCVVTDTRAVHCYGYCPAPTFDDCQDPSSGTCHWGGCLGYGNTEILGDDEAPSEAGPVDIGGPVLDLALGDQHTCALLESGDVRCWGAGVLGYANEDWVGDDETPSSLPHVELGEAAVQIVALSDGTCARLESGAVRCWGRNFSGSLGLGHGEPIGDDELPTAAAAVDLGAPLIDMAAGGLTACALRNDGALYCWGLNDQGELGGGFVGAVGDDELPGNGPRVPVFEAN